MIKNVKELKEKLSLKKITVSKQESSVKNSAQVDLLNELKKSSRN